MEDDFIYEYIGKDADKFTNKKYNWSSALFGQAIGPIWFFYRKSYLLGFLFIFITIALEQIATKINFTESSYIMFFIYLITTNKLYLWDVRRKVRKLITSYDLSEDRLIEMIKKKGGTSKLAVVIYAIAFMLITAFNIAIVYLSMYTQK